MKKSRLYSGTTQFNEPTGARHRKISGKSFVRMLAQQRLKRPTSCCCGLQKSLVQVISGSQDAAARQEFASKVPAHIRVGFGLQGLLESCSEGSPDIVLIAVVGIAGLPPLIESLDRGTKVALANKESLVCGGHIVRQKQAASKAEIFPVDSELCAIYQCLGGMNTKGLSRLILTASGGPFFDWPAKKIQNATVEQALRHPNWRMGQKITVDCATYMNKGLRSSNRAGF